MFSKYDFGEDPKKEKNVTAFTKKEGSEVCNEDLFIFFVHFRVFHKFLTYNLLDHVAPRPSDLVDFIYFLDSR
jgi:hypothetical protein